MLNRSILISVVILIFAVCALAQDAPVFEKKPYILIDSDTLPGMYFETNLQHSKFKAALKDIDMNLDHRSLSEFSAAALEGVDVLVIINPCKKLGEEDKFALRQYLRDGGALLVMADGEVWYYAPDLQNLGSFLMDYGINFFDYTGPSNPMILDVVENSTLNLPRPCKKLSISDRWVYLDVDDNNASAAAVTSGGRVLAAVSKHKNLKKGRLVVIGESRMFTNKYINKKDNEDFGLNVMEYLYGSCDLTVLVSKYRGSNLRAGKNIKLIGRIKNIGNRDSKPTKVRFALKAADDLPASNDAMIILDTLDLPALTPDKRKKLKTKYEIPDDMAAGDYYLVTIVDPAGDSGDRNTANNSRDSKKLTIQ